MQFLKNLGRGLASAAFVLLIIATAVVTALVMTFNSPKKIEKSLSDSGVYKNFVSGALKEVQRSNQTDTKSNENIPVNNPIIIAAANKAFSPQLLQSTTENVLDGTYNWLTGKVATPNFTINFVAAKQTFAEGVGQAAQKHLASIPVCTPVQARASSPELDPFNATCRPAGLNIADEGNKITNNLANSKDFLGTPKLTPQNLPRNSSGKTIYEQLALAPKVYKWVNASPWLLALLTIIAAAVSFLLHDSRRKGLRKLAIVTTGAGVLLLFSSFSARHGLHHLSAPDSKLGATFKGSFQQTIIKALNSISDSVEHVILWFGLIYLLAGVTVLVVLYFTKPKKPVTETEKEALPADNKASSKTKAVDAKPAVKPDSKPVQG